MGAIRRTAAPPLPYLYIGTARTKKAPLVYELIKGLLLPTPPRTWHRRTGGQLKTWATTIKADLEPLSGTRVFDYARWKKDWAKIFLLKKRYLMLLKIVLLREG